jgi:hypothetical protein
MSNSPCKKTAVGSKFEDAEIAGLQKTPKDSKENFTKKLSTQKQKKRRKKTKQHQQWVCM